MATQVKEEAANASQLSADAAELNLVEFWKQRAALEGLEPRADAQAYRWKWRDLEPRLRLAGETVPIEDCERRALVFANPGLGGMPHVTDNLFAAFSLYKAGETAPVHRHTPCASRFVVEGDGGFTVVEGEKCKMNRGDLIITPAGTWHDHGNEGSESLIWMDVLDLPIVSKLNLTFFEFDYGEAKADKSGAHPIATGYQEVTEADDISQKLYSAGGMLPLFAPERRGLTGNHSPQFVYRWQAARRALENLAGHPGSLHDGLIMEYVNPTNGRPVMPNMSFRVQMLRPGEETALRRRLSTAVYFCLEGEGLVEVDGEQIEWGRNDVFAMPSWRWSKFKNTGSENAFLYSVTDEPVVRATGLYREERETADGGREFVVFTSHGERVVEL